MKLERIVIFGGSGGFGRLFASRFAGAGAGAGANVVRVDVVGDADIICDASQDLTPAASALAEADLVLLCLPEVAALEVLDALDDHFGAGAGPLIADICSVKSRIVASVQTRCVGCEYVTLHPMFGPERELAGSNLIFMPLRDGARGGALRDLLLRWQLHVVDADAQTHDQVTSLVQVLTHAVLATFANARSRFGLPEETIDAFATPVFRDLDRVSQGMVGENPRLYHNIQNANPHGDAARARLREALEETLSILAQDDAAATQALFERVRKAPGKDQV